VGAIISALPAADEAFKLVMRRLPLRSQSDLVYFEPSYSCGFDFGAIQLPNLHTVRIDLETVDLISAGAISQAALFALLRVPNLSMSGRIFDDDLTASSNLNRNMLSLIDDVGLPKVDVVARRCAPHIKLHPVGTRFAEGGGVGKLAQRVLVGVDDIPSRWAVQKQNPAWLAVSGTSHYSVSSSVHEPNQPCSGCLHPVDDPMPANPIPTSCFVSLWAGLAMAVRLLRDALGWRYPDDRQHLWMTPLRMDLSHAAIWSPVPPRQDCPVKCALSRRV
jgi:hypothetical protein